MKTEELVRGLPYDRGNTYVCELCVHSLVAPRARWLMTCEDIFHALGQIIFAVGLCLGTIMLGGLYVFEAFFPHINSAKSPDDIEAERRQREWEDERQREWEEAREKLALQDEYDRVEAEVIDEAAYLNSFKARFASQSTELKLADELVDHWNSTVGSMSDSKDFKLDQVHLRKNAVESEDLYALEAAKNARRSQVRQDVDYHTREMSHWNNRAYAAYDSKEKQRCEREAEHHAYKASQANSIYESI